MTLYIDPGTGSMLFTILIGVIGAAMYSLRMLLIKIRFKLSGGKVEMNADEIPFAIFSDDKRYWNIFEPICREMSKRGKEVVYLTASEDDPALTCDIPNMKAEFIGSDNKAFARLNFLNATILLSTTPGLDVYQWKRSKGVRYYVHIPHMTNDITLYRMFGLDYYDAILVGGDYHVDQIRALETLRDLPEKEIVKVGYPYMDVMASRFEQAGNVSAEVPTVLLAPSWGPSALFSVYGGKIIDALLKTGYHVIVRPHPQSFKSETALMDKLMADYPPSAQLEWNRDRDNFEVLRRSDILVSDFSGVTFEFSLIYDKPVIYTNPNFDLAPYDAWWLNEPLWTSNALPRLGYELTEENIHRMKDLIDSCLADEKFSEGRKAVKAETWSHYGCGTEQVVSYLLQKYDELTAVTEEN